MSTTFVSNCVFYVKYGGLFPPHIFIKKYAVMAGLEKSCIKLA